jgi:hypothetical protein
MAADLTTVGSVAIYMFVTVNMMILSLVIWRRVIKYLFPSFRCTYCLNLQDKRVSYGEK